MSGSSVRLVALLVGVNKPTSAHFYHWLREIIAYQLEPESHEVFDGEIEVDESYFGGRRKGKRGRVAAGETPVFGLLKRGGKSMRRLFQMLVRQT